MLQCIAHKTYSETQFKSERRQFLINKEPYLFKEYLSVASCGNTNVDIE